MLRALPWAIAGILLGLFTGNIVNDETFKKLIAIVIFSGLGIMIWRKYIYITEKIPSNHFFSAAMGLAGGFSTMIGNAAGPVMAVYLLSLRLQKNIYIGTGAWFFLIMNVFKFPLHMFVWKTINIRTLTIDLAAIPAIAIGAFAGIWVVKKINEKYYQWLVIAATIYSAFLMLLG